MTIDRFLGSIVLGLIVSWAAMHAGINLYTAVTYIASGMPGASTAWVHLGLTGAIVSYLLFRD